MADSKENKDDDKDAFERLREQKSAILMMLIGEEDEILKNLSPREVQHLGAAMYSVQDLVRIWSIRCDEFCHHQGTNQSWTGPATISAMF